MIDLKDKYIKENNNANEDMEKNNIMDEAKETETIKTSNKSKIISILDNATEVNDKKHNSYSVNLDFFEGPLDLLLKIIKDKKMDIETVNLGDLTDQYLAYINTSSVFDLENASEFIEMAAQLLEIKSRILLPVENVEEDDFFDPELDLRSRLKEKELFLEASNKLAEVEDINKLYKKPDKMAGNVKIILKDMVLSSMLDAFANMMATIPAKIITAAPPKQIAKDRFTVKDKILSIKTIISQNKKMDFEDLFEDDLTKSELINTFLALLELLKHQYIFAEQTDIFGKIIVNCNEEKINEEIQDGQFEGDN